VETDGSVAQERTLDAERLLELLYRRDVALSARRSVIARMLRVTETELLALIHLLHQGDLAPSRIAELLDLSSGGATALVQRLAAGGHITRHPHPNDRRSTLLRIAPRTAAALADADKSLLPALDALSDKLSGEQQATVAAFLSELADLFEELAAAQRGERSQGANALDRPVPSLWA
jgi:DNA-binding MarR family transcriptional regulator